MSRNICGAVMAFSLAIGMAMATEGEGSEVRPDHPKRHPPLPKKLLEKFDADKDGRLNEAEREALRAAMKEHALEIFDADGDGTLSEAERVTMRETIKEHRLERLDKNGDGELSPREKAAANLRDRDNNPPGPKGGPGTNWENRPGPQGGPGTSPDIHRDRDNNPPGAKGGPGTNWENPPGAKGGPGASPNRHGGGHGGAKR